MNQSLCAESRFDKVRILKFARPRLMSAGVRLLGNPSPEPLTNITYCPLARFMLRTEKMAGAPWMSRRRPTDPAPKFSAGTGKQSNVWRQIAARTQHKEWKMETLVTVLIVLLVMGLAIYLVNRFLPIDPRIKMIINGIIVLLVIIYLLQLAGLLGG